jgi:hypothetical protein
VTSFIFNRSPSPGKRGSFGEAVSTHLPRLIIPRKRESLQAVPHPSENFFLAHKKSGNAFIGEGNIIKGIFREEKPGNQNLQARTKSAEIRWLEERIREDFGARVPYNLQFNPFPERKHGTRTNQPDCQSPRGYWKARRRTSEVSLNTIESPIN